MNLHTVTHKNDTFYLIYVDFRDKTKKIGYLFSTVLERKYS